MEKKKTGLIVGAVAGGGCLLMVAMCGCFGIIGLLSGGVGGDAPEFTTEPSVSSDAPWSSESGDGGEVLADDPEAVTYDPWDPNDDAILSDPSAG